MLLTDNFPCESNAEYDKVEYGPNWSASLALSPLKIVEPGKVCSEMLMAVGTPTHCGALSLTSLTTIFTGIGVL